jgi:hypothetical protein
MHMNDTLYKHIVENKIKRKICAKHPVSHWKDGYKRCYWGFKLNQDCEELQQKGGDRNERL